jgi:hypothetical protein
MMKISDKKMRRIIREEYSLLLSEKVDLSKSSDPSEMWKELQALRGNRDIDLLEKLGPDKYTSLLALRDQYSSDPNGYNEFYKLVVLPGSHLAQYKFDPETNKMTTVSPPRNDYMLFGNVAKAVFDGRTGVVPAQTAAGLKTRRDELDSQFERSDATDRADSMYGRKRHKVIHTPTGTVVAGGVNRQGSLGT